MYIYKIEKKEGKKVDLCTYHFVVIYDCVIIYVNNNVGKHKLKRKGGNKLPVKHVLQSRILIGFI